MSTGDYRTIGDYCDPQFYRKLQQSYHQELLKLSSFAHAFFPKTRVRCLRASQTRGRLIFARQDSYGLCYEPLPLGCCVSTYPTLEAAIAHADLLWSDLLPNSLKLLVDPEAPRFPFTERRGICEEAYFNRRYLGKRPVSDVLKHLRF